MDRGIQISMNSVNDVSKLKSMNSSSIAPVLMIQAPVHGAKNTMPTNDRRPSTYAEAQRANYPRFTCESCYAPCIWKPSGLCDWCYKYEPYHYHLARKVVFPCPLLLPAPTTTETKSS